ncbi:MULTISPECIES: sensor histidine kinase KdpD [Virgibacillus]|uniref:histidine kinase n=3 Tax=Virgibacillus TaxID=84406 RepID=A0A941I9F8_9BACI|nr:MULTISPECIES: HAMP domain-containing sensor histidine kinase [Virgibacillus]MBR7795483.1 HAMP domain-containing histidine kinase [Virgibacillus salarius]NAZ08196.1 GHKL domain-containing protein [Agaribacter marinus]
MVKWLRSFRAKIIGMFALSSLLSGLLTYLIIMLAKQYYSTVDYGSTGHAIREFIRTIGDVYVFLFIFIVFSFLFFYMLMKPYTTYFNKISKGIRQLAQGDFDYQVKLSSKDEFNDIANDINRTSARLKEAIEKGEFLESSKDHLIVNLAHDLRTPLTSVLGYIEIILKDKTLGEEEKMHFLKIAFNKSQRLERLLDELFEITKMNDHMYSIEKTKINISALLYQLAEEMYPIFEKSSLHLRQDIQSNLMTLGDGDLLARVFENLLTNANRYGSDGEFIDIRAFQENQEAIIQVINYGSIIADEDLPHIFDMFYTGDKSRTMQKNKSGLGLFIAKNIIEQHNGTITAKSNLKQTVFEVRLTSSDDE